MRTAFVASALFIVLSSSFIACNTRTPVGDVDHDGGAGTTGTGGTTGVAGNEGIAGTGWTVDTGGAGSFGDAGTTGTGGTTGVGGTFGCPSMSPITSLFLGPTYIPFPDPNNYVTGALAVGDLDGDKIADVVVGGFPQPLPSTGGAGSSGTQGIVAVTITKAQGFAAPKTYGPVAPDSLAIADVNGDKLPDLISSSVFGPSILLNTGTGALGAPTSYSAAVGVFATGDLDGDGKAEMAFTVRSDVPGAGSGIVVLKSSGGSTFAAQNYDDGFDAYGIAVGEVDGHAGLDLVAGGKQGVHVFSNDGSGHFAAPTAYSGATNTVALADIDGDGKLDIVGSDSNSYSVRINLGGGQFAVPRVLPLGDGTGAAKFGDVDGDGKVDAVVTSQVCSSLAVYFNDGNGSFGTPWYIPEGPRAFMLADVNGDKALDLVINDSRGLISVRFHRAP